MRHRIGHYQYATGRYSVGRLPNGTDLAGKLKAESAQVVKDLKTASDEINKQTGIIQAPVGATAADQLAAAQAATTARSTALALQTALIDFQADIVKKSADQKVELNGTRMKTLIAAVQEATTPDKKKEVDTAVTNAKQVARFQSVLP